METRSLSAATHHGKDALWSVRPKAFSEKGLKRTVKQITFACDFCVYSSPLIHPIQ